MFTKLGPSAAQSSDGFTMRRATRYTVQYEEAPRVMTVEVEDARTPDDEYYLAIYRQSIQRWNAPYDQEPVSEAKREEIVRRVADAPAFLGVRTTIE